MNTTSKQYFFVNLWGCDDFFKIDGYVSQFPVQTYCLRDIECHVSFESVLRGDFKKCMYFRLSLTLLNVPTPPLLTIE